MVQRSAPFIIAYESYTEPDVTSHLGSNHTKPYVGADSCQDTKPLHKPNFCSFTLADNNTNFVAVGASLL